MSKKDIYGINKWGKGFFEISKKVNLALKNPFEKKNDSVELIRVIRELNEKYSPPYIIRIIDYLEYMIYQIHQNFDKSIKEIGYKNKYRGVFPVKVNQQAQVVEKITSYGKKLDFGLEVGSKPELLIALGQKLSKNSLIVCNGIKDEEFITLCLLSSKLGIKIVIVLESIRELNLIVKISKKLKILPLLGMRIKLTNTISGKWSQSSGDRSAFGLPVEKITEVISILKKNQLLECLILQHSHLGSQVPDIIEIRKYTQEACRFFCEITKEGAPLRYLDLGGGLGIDYTGQNKSISHSINYSLEEYCFNIVETVKLQLDREKINHPVIITESGRACVAASSILIFNILDTTIFDSKKCPEITQKDHIYLSYMKQILNYLEKERLQECFNDLNYYRDELRILFRNNQINLKDMAKIEKTYLFILNKMKSLLLETKEISDDVLNTINNLADIYHGNFSVFQSLPDVWAIDQLHPIAPIHKLSETPKRRAVLNDITCDSDGMISKFVLNDGISKTLPVHEIKNDEDYYLGVFFVGAYQETLGDLHNLFGDTNVASIKLFKNSKFKIIHKQVGDKVSEVLSYVEYSPSKLINNFIKILNHKQNSDILKLTEKNKLLKTFKDSLQGYTYFEN